MFQKRDKREYEKRLNDRAQQCPGVKPVKVERRKRRYKCRRVDRQHRFTAAQAEVHEPVAEMPFVGLEGMPSLSEPQKNDGGRVIQGDGEEYEGQREGQKADAGGVERKRK